MKNWWGKYSLNTDKVIEKTIGPLFIKLEFEERELKLYYDYNIDWDENQIDEESLDIQAPSMNQLRERFVIQEGINSVTLLPMLADRSVVAQPSTPFYLSADSSITVYISTPLWVRFIQGSKEDVLIELPAFRPSDTWFGPNTMEGELCYASHTSARISTHDLVTRVHRAVTPVQIINESNTHLLIERINLPVTYLEIFETESGQLWTQGVRMVKNANDETAKMELLPGPHESAIGAARLTQAREIASENTIIRKISGFFA